MINQMIIAAEAEVAGAETARRCAGLKVPVSDAGVQMRTEVPASVAASARCVRFCEACGSKIEARR